MQSEAAAIFIRGSGPDRACHIQMADMPKPEVAIGRATAMGDADGTTVADVPTQSSANSRLP